VEVNVQSRAGRLVGLVIREVEAKANMPPRICWSGEVQSGSEMSDFQSSAQVFDVAIWSDSMLDQSANIPQSVAGS
jgi:hypothetical protein